MHCLLLVLLLPACGRVGFDGGTGTDATGSTGDGRRGDAPTIDGPAGGGYASLVLADNPVAYYRMNETSLGAVADATGHGHEAQSYIVGGVITFGVPGALASDLDPAMRLVGDGNLGMNNRAALTFPESVYIWDGDFTIEGWLKPGRPPLGFDHGFLVWEDYLVSGFRTGWTNTLQPRFWTDQAGASSTIVAPTALVQDTWNHLVFVKAGLTITIYLAGQQSVSTSITYKDPPISIDDCLGSDHGMPTDAVFDELALYDRALTPEQIAAHHTAGITP